jgi:hypothetical protein
MYLGTLYIYTKFRLDQISNMAVRPGGHFGKSIKSYYSWTNGWIISKFLSLVLLISIHDIIPRFLFDLFKVTEVKVRNKITKLTYFFYHLTWKVLTLHERVSRHHLRFYQISAQLHFKYGHQVAFLEKHLSAVTPELMPGSSQNLNHIMIHDILPGILICPTFQGHRGQSSAIVSWHVWLLLVT